MTLKFPPLWTLAAFVATIVLNGIPILRLSNTGFGFLGLVAGFGLILWAGLSFRGRNTPIHPGHTPKQLITTGPFTLNRNPIYTGMVLMTVGLGMAQGSLLGLIPAFVLWWALDRHFAAPEEQAVIDAFGDEGRAYVADVRRW